MAVEILARDLGVPVADGRLLRPSDRRLTLRVLPGTIVALEAGMVEADIHFVGALSSAYRRAAWLGLPVVNTDLVLYYAVGRSSLMQRQLPNIFGAS